MTDTQRYRALVEAVRALSDELHAIAETYRQGSGGPLIREVKATQADALGRELARMIPSKAAMARMEVGT